MLKLKDEDFLKLVNYIQANYGINLSTKKIMIESRLSQTILNLGYKDFDTYVHHILHTSSKSDIEIMLNKLTTNYTYFMREFEHFEYFKNVILPDLEKNKKNKVLSIWSAGCSSGEEPYTLSIIMKDYFGKNAHLWDTKILATDISQKVLNAAKMGIYDEESISSIPHHWKNNYFKKLPNGSYSVVDEIKENVVFREFNLMDPIKFKLKFDVIFCRNVMIYFDQETKNQLVLKFYEATNPSGHLIIGKAESLNKQITKYKYVQLATYKK